MDFNKDVYTSKIYIMGEHPFKTEYEEIISHLQQAQLSIESIENTKINPLKMRITSVLRREIGVLQAMIGSKVGARDPALVVGASEVAARGTEVKPLKKFFGVTIPSVAPRKKNQGDGEGVVVKSPDEAYREYRDKADTTAENTAYQELKAKVDRLTVTVPQVDSQRVLDEVDEMTLRALGRSAGLPITETEPKVLDVAYVDAVKRALKQKQQNADQNK